MCKKLEKVFDRIYVSFEYMFETVSLILHGHNSLERVFQKNCHELLLRNVVICRSICMASLNNFCAGPNISEYCWSGHTR